MAHENAAWWSDFTGETSCADLLMLCYSVVSPVRPAVTTVRTAEPARVHGLACRRPLAQRYGTSRSHTVVAYCEDEELGEDGSNGVFFDSAFAGCLRNLWHDCRCRL